MKNLFKIMMVAVIIMGITATAMSKDFKGVITYKISYPGLDIDPGMMAMMPKMATLTIKGDMSKLRSTWGKWEARCRSSTATPKQ
jgi:hypothetical protein